ncbi:MAG TPA: carboxypeptidase-like regulatory domain-containing protein [Bryobacteraceae bacterium]|nr:carboxypeptidase-like regulatory domain-containing protein [Bryobacteraceae bacterium]
MNKPDRLPVSVSNRHTYPGRSFWLLGLLVVALAFSQLPAFAQFASGSIGGTVTDATGAVVPQAKVVLKNEASGALRESATNNSGFFNFPSILPGTYTITVSAPGLQTFEEQGITLNQGQTLSLPKVTLQVQSTKQEVEVVAGADVVVPVDSGTSEQTLNKNMVENLSIVGRDAAELIKIMPGMAMTSGLGQSMWNSYTTQSNNGPIGNFSAMGTQPNGAMTMTSDGANLLDPGNQGTQTANINQNQVQEVSILTSSYGAEYAKGPVTFQAIGKSGGSQFHGGGYFYARNSVFNANDWYNNRNGVKAPTDSFYYPGGDFGGPVLIPGTHFNRNRDKLFFYAAYEYMDQKPAGYLNSYFVPTSDMLNGNFSQAYLNSLGPNFKNARSAAYTTPGANCNMGVAQSFCPSMAPGGMIPSTMLDPDSAKYLGLFPKPNVDPVTNATGSNYEFFVGPPVNRWELRLRGDYNISDKTKLFFSWNRQDEKDQNPIAIWWSIAGSLPYPSSQNATQVSNIYSANLVHVFSPTLTNEFVFADAKFVNPIILGNPAAVDPSKLGINFTGLFKNPFVPQIPNTYGWSNSAVGFATYPYGEPWSPGGSTGFGKLSNTPNVSDNITKVQGSHTIKAGVYLDYAQNWQTGGGFNTSSQGGIEFDPWGGASTGNPLADWVTGRMSNLAQDQSEAVANFKYYQYSFFVNDQWKASRRLTLTGGLRFEHMGNWFPNSGPGLAVWDPATYNNTCTDCAFTGLQWHAINPAIPMSGSPSKSFFVEPRFGFAYDLFGNGKTVLRGGAGLFRYQLAYNTASGVAFSAPLGIPTGVTTTGSANINGVSTACCVGWNQFPEFTPSLGAAGLGSSIAGVLAMGDNRTPNTWTYNFTVSQRTPGRSVAEFQYQGNRSRDLLQDGPLSNVDNIPLGAFFGPDPITGINYYAQGKLPSSGAFNLNDFYPYHQYTNITLIGHGSYSNYNAFIATWQKQSGRMTFTANYTFSKVIGIRDNQTANGPGAGNTLDPFNIQNNYGVLAWDHTHIFNAAYVFNLPSPIKGNPFLGGVVNGWVLSGITQFQSGAPIQPNTAGDLNVNFPTALQPTDYLGTNAFSATEPAIICDPRKNLGPNQYFNPGCFAPPTGGVNGSVIWPYIKGPAFFNSDLAIYKDFLFKEHHKVELRFSAFNFLNHPLWQFGTGGIVDEQLSFANSSGNLTQTNQNALTTGAPLFKVGRRVVEFAAKYNF